MITTNITDSQTAYRGMETTVQVLLGRTQVVSFQEEWDEAAAGTFDSLVVEIERPEFGTSGKAEMAQAQLQVLALAMRRDAQHTYATRGQLLRHAVQSNILRNYEAGRLLEGVGV